MIIVGGVVAAGFALGLGIGLGLKPDSNEKNTPRTNVGYRVKNTTSPIVKTRVNSSTVAVTSLISFKINASKQDKLSCTNALALLTNEEAAELS